MSTNVKEAQDCSAGASSGGGGLAFRAARTDEGRWRLEALRASLLPASSTDKDASDGTKETEDEEGEEEKEFEPASASVRRSPARRPSWRLDQHERPFA